MKFLKFQSEAAAIAAFAPWATDEATYPNYIGAVAVDVVGVIYKPTGSMLDTDDGPVPEFEVLPGWHVNLSGEVPELAAFEIDAPDTPARIFAGAL